MFEYVRDAERGPHQPRKFTDQNADQVGSAMNRFVHRLIMALLLAAALAVIWNVLGSR